jgi:signal transduction histidine kinase
MDIYGSSDRADRFAISFRWLALIGLTISLARGNQLHLPWNLLLVIPGAWNLVMTFLAGTDRRIENHRQISLAIDLTVCGTFFWLQGGMAGAAFWVGVVPIFTASIYFGLTGALLFGLVICVLEVISIFMKYPPITSPHISLIAGGATLLLSLVLGWLGRGALQEVHLSHEQTNELDRRIKMLEETLKNLSRDLHDGPIQSLSVIAMRSNLARQIPGRDANKMAEEIEKIEESARKATDEMRQILVTLKNSKPGKHQ